MTLIYLYFSTVLLFLLSVQVFGMGNYEKWSKHCTISDSEVIINLPSDCCKKDNRNMTLVVTGKIRNLTIDITDTVCANKFSRLVIKNTNLTEFNGKMNGLQKIVKLEIQDNKILKELGKLMVDKIGDGNLKSIQITGNGLRTIRKENWVGRKGIKQVTTLELINNKINYVGQNALDGFINLIYLDVSGNLLTELNQLAAPNITTLIAKRNPLHGASSLSNLLTKLSNLKKLELSLPPTTIPIRSGILYLPRLLFLSLKYLQFLSLNNLHIGNVSSLAFYGLDNLSELSLAANRIQYLPPGTLQQMRSLQRLSLAYNQISCLPDKMLKSLPQLTYFDLSNNRLTYISTAAMRSLKHLTELNLQGNVLRVIESAALVQLPSLRKIQIDLVAGQLAAKLRSTPGPFAGLPKNTTIIGLEDYGIFNGQGKPVEQLQDRSDISNSSCPEANLSVDSPLGTNAASRKFLLIIVGVCVLFLLIALAVIMTYRAWSKRKSLAEKQQQQQNLVLMPSSPNGGTSPNPAICSGDDEQTALTNLAIL